MVHAMDSWYLTIKKHFSYQKSLLTIFDDIQFSASKINEN